MGHHSWVFCEWAPIGFGNSSNPVLLTINSFPDIRLWTVPSSWRLNQLQLLCDLTDPIRASKEFKDCAPSLTSYQACFADDNQTCIISAGPLLYYFAFTSTDTGVVCQLVGVSIYKSVITSLCWKSGMLVVGDENGEIGGVTVGSVELVPAEPSSLPVEPSPFPVEPSSLPVEPSSLPTEPNNAPSVLDSLDHQADVMNPTNATSTTNATIPPTNTTPPQATQNDEDWKEDRPFRFEGESSPLWTVQSPSPLPTLSLRWEFQLPSLYRQPFALQASVQSIRRAGDALFATDGVTIAQLTWNSLWEVARRVEIPEGVAFFGVTGAGSSIQCVTKTFAYQVVDLLSSRTLCRHSLMEDFPSVSDMFFVGGVPLGGEEPGVLLACQVITQQRTTSVDLLRQQLVIRSLAVQNGLSDAYSADSVEMSHGTPHLCPTPALLTLYPNAIQRFLPQLWSEATNDLRQEQLLHAAVSKCILEEQTWWTESRDDAVARFLDLRRALWSEALLQRKEPLALWLAKVLRGEEEEASRSQWMRPCPCCGEPSLLHWGHASWCLLRWIDDYCPLSLAETITDRQTVCPCCQTTYRTDGKCVYCGLALLRVTETNRERRVDRYRINSCRTHPSLTDWNVLSFVC